MKKEFSKENINAFWNSNLKDNILMPREPATFMGIHYCKKHNTKTKWMDRTYNPFCAECIKEDVTKGFKNSRIAMANELSIKQLEEIIEKKKDEHKWVKR